MYIYIYMYLYIIYIYVIYIQLKAMLKAIAWNIDIFISLNTLYIKYICTKDSISFVLHSIQCNNNTNQHMSLVFTSLVLINCLGAVHVLKSYNDMLWW